MSTYNTVIATTNEEVEKMTFYKSFMSKMITGNLKKMNDDTQAYNLASEAYNCAAMDGQLETVKWMHKKQFPWSEHTCVSAAGKGHLEVLKYAHEHGCPWNKNTCSWAAGEGRLEVLKYVHEHGCPWDEDTCMSAAESGHFEVLRYAHEHGCPWDKDSCMWAVRKGHLSERVDMLELTSESGLPWDTHVPVAKGGYLEILQWVRDDCPPE